MFPQNATGWCKKTRMMELLALRYGISERNELRVKPAVLIAVYQNKIESSWCTYDKVLL